MHHQPPVHAKGAVQHPDLLLQRRRKRFLQIQELRGACARVWMCVGSWSVWLRRGTPPRLRRSGAGPAQGRSGAAALLHEVCSQHPGCDHGTSERPSPADHDPASSEGTPQAWQSAPCRPPVQVRQGMRGPSTKLIHGMAVWAACSRDPAHGCPVPAPARRSLPTPAHTFTLVCFRTGASPVCLNSIITAWE